MAIYYLHMYKRGEASTCAILEFHTSKGNLKLRNLSWLKDEFDLSTSEKVDSALRRLGITGYVAKVSDLEKLPRNTKGEILKEYEPFKVTRDVMLGYIVEQKLKSKGRDY